MLAVMMITFSTCVAIYKENCKPNLFKLLEMVKKQKCKTGASVARAFADLTSP